MRCLKLIAAVVLAGAGAAACAPNPIVARDPVPAPSSDEAYTCDSRSLALNAFRTSCERAPVRDRALVRAKG